MSLTHGMDPGRVREIGEKLQGLGEQVTEVQGQGTAMIRVLEDVWSGADLENVSSQWGSVGPMVHNAGTQLKAAGSQIIEEADDQERASDGEGSRGGGDDGKSWWDKAKDFGSDLLDKGKDFVDSVGDKLKDFGDWVNDGLDWANEQWKKLASMEWGKKIIDLLEDIGELFDNLPVWGKVLIGAVLAVAAIAAIVYFGLPVLAVLGVAFTIYGVLESLDEIAEFLRDPKGFVEDWWKNSSTFEKIVTIGSIVLAPFGGRILGPILRKLDGPAEKAADWLRRKLGRGKDPDPPSTPKKPDIPERRHDYTDEDGNPVKSKYADDQVDGPTANKDLDGTLAKHGMTREEFDRALEQRVPKDPADLTPEQRKLMAVRDEMGAPKAGEPMQKVLKPNDYENYMNGKYGGTGQGSVTRLSDGMEMGTPRELHDGLALGYDGSPFTPDMDSVKVMRFSSTTDTDISRYSSMGGKSNTDSWPNPYTGNGFTKSTDPVVPESKLPDGSKIQDGAEIWTVNKDGSQVLDAVYDADTNRWVKVR